MTDDPTPTAKKRGPSDATDYSSTKAPETQAFAEQRDGPIDHRLFPGGAHGSPVDPGMSSLDRDTVIGGGENPGQQKMDDIER